MSREVEKIHATELQHQDRWLGVKVYYDYSDKSRTVVVQVARSRWDARNYKNDCIFHREFRQSAEEQSELDEHVLEAIASVKDEIDAAERACERSTWDVMTDLWAEYA